MYMFQSVHAYTQASGVGCAHQYTWYVPISPSIHKHGGDREVGLHAPMHILMHPITPGTPISPLVCGTLRQNVVELEHLSSYYVPWTQLEHSHQTDVCGTLGLNAVQSEH